MMQTQDRITALGAEDLPRVVEVWEASVRATHHFLSEANIQFFKSLVADELAQLETLVGVRDPDGRIVAFIGVDGVEVAALFVHPEWRSQEVGRRLLTYAVETLGATQLDVNEQNDQAVGFYRHMGFEVVGRSPEDGLGQPFPLLHMRVSRLAQAAPGVSVRGEACDGVHRVSQRLVRSVWAHPGDSHTS